MSSKNKQNAVETGRVYWIRVRCRAEGDAKSQHAAARAALLAAYRTPGIDAADMIENSELVNLATGSVTDAIENLNRICEDEPKERETRNA